MKFVTHLGLVATAVVLSGPVFAQVSAGKNVVVNATLQSKCVFDSGTDLTLATATYPAFTTTPVTATAPAITMQCTRGGGTPSIIFGPGPTSAPDGVVAGLAYQLSAVYGGDSAGSDPTGVAGNIGVPRTGNFTVTATFPAGQAGTSTASATDTKAMTIKF